MTSIPPEPPKIYGSVQQNTLVLGKYRTSTAPKLVILSPQQGRLQKLFTSTVTIPVSQLGSIKNHEVTTASVAHFLGKWKITVLWNALLGSLPRLIAESVNRKDAETLKGMDLPRLRQHIEILANDDPSLKSTEAFLNTLEATESLHKEITPEAVAEECMNLPWTTLKLLTQKSMNSKNRYQIAIAKTVLNKRYIQPCMEAAQKGEMEIAIHTLTNLSTFTKNAPPNFLPNLLPDLERALGDKRMQFVEATIDHELKAPDQSQVFRGPAMKFAWHLCQQEVEGKLKIEKQDTPSAYVNEAISQITKIPLSKLPITHKIFSLMHEKTKAAKDERQADLLTFSTFSLRILGDRALKEQGREAADLFMTLYTFYASAKGIKLTDKGKQLTQPSAFDFLQGQSQLLEKFIQQLSIPPE